MKLASLLLLLAPAAAQARGDVIAVFELKSRVPGQQAQPDTAALTDQVRGVAQRALPDARVLSSDVTPRAKEQLKAARSAGADRMVVGEVLRIDAGFLVTLALHETKDGKLVATASGTGSTPEELSEAVAGAAVDLFRAAQPVQAGVAIGPAPEKPALPAPLVDEEVLAEAGALVAYDKARTADGAGKDRPDVAAAAWREVAELGGANPFREMAEARAHQWETYAQTRHAYEAQLARDSGRLRKVLPLASVTDKSKLDLIVRFSHAYGPAEAAPMLALLASPALRDRAGLAVGCETKDAAQCIALARTTDDPRSAVEYLEQACDAGAADACADAADRWLSQSMRDPARAVALLERGCAAKSGAACARLARVYEEGDGTDVNNVLAAETREKACAAGDGRSCRKLACEVDAGDQARALDLWEQGCSKGDSVSCALAQLSSARPAAIAAVAVEKPAAPAPAPVAVAVKTVQKPRGRTAVGGVMVGLGLAAMGGAVYLANSDDGHDMRRSGRNFMTLREEPGMSRRDTAKLLALGSIVSGTLGVLVLMSTSSEPDATKVAVGPGAVAISGAFK